MLKKFFYFLLTFIMTVTVVNAQSVTSNVEIRTEAESLDIYDITELYEEADKENLSHDEFSLKLRNHALEEKDNLEKVKSVSVKDKKAVVELEIEKSYLVTNEDDLIDPFVIIGPSELGGDIVVNAKSKDEKELLIKKSVIGTKNDTTDFTFKVLIDGKEEEITLKNNEVKKINIKKGQTFEVKEENIPEGYSLESIKNEKGVFEEDILVDVTNIYQAKGEYQIKAKKFLKGKDLEDEQFTFQLLKDGKVIEEVTNKGEDIVFSTIKFTERDLEEEHVYTVREKNDEQENIVYDTNEIEIKLTLKDDNKGNILVESNKDEIVFNNEYTPDKPKDKQARNNSRTGVAGIGGVALVLASALVAYKKNK